MIWDSLLNIVAAVAAIPMIVLIVESLAALLPSRLRAAEANTPRPRCAVLIPAHDEELGIGRTLASIRPQLFPGDRLIVVADNCGDRTAEVARAEGAEVLERWDTARRGKGYALDYGVRFLERDPPEVAVVIDADCTVYPGAIDLLVRRAIATNCPVQASNLLEAPARAGWRSQISSFAFQYKNLVRSLGRSRLRVPCLLTGTGMAFPWPLIRDASLSSGNIVEDLQLGLDLALIGFPANLCPEAKVTSELPADSRTALEQRKRWEHGHLQTLFTQVPRLIGSAFRRRRLALLGLALDLSVPPLAMLFLLWAATLTGLLAWWSAGGSEWPALILAGSGLGALLSICLAWVKFGRERLPLKSLLTVPLYLVWKVPVYLAYFFHRQQAWVRTERGLPAAPEKSTLKGEPRA